MNPFQIHELIIKILSYISDGKTYKSILFTSRLFYKIASQELKKMRDQFANHFLTILNLYPDENWNWNLVSRNANLRQNFLLNHIRDPKFKWHAGILTQHPAIPIDIFMKYSFERTSYSLNPNLTWQQYWNMRDYFDRNQLSYTFSRFMDPYDYWNILSFHAASTKLYLVKYALLLNSKLTLDFIQKHPKVGILITEYLSHPNMSWPDIKKYIIEPKIQLTYDICEKISQNPNLTWDIILNELIPWEWGVISNNGNIFKSEDMQKAWNFISSHPNYNWDWFALSTHLAWDIIYTHSDFIIKHLDMLYYTSVTKLLAKFISMNRTVTPKIIEENPDFSWNWDGISLNPNLTFSFIIKHKEKINFNLLSDNQFGEEKLTHFNYY